MCYGNMSPNLIYNTKIKSSRKGSCTKFNKKELYVCKAYGVGGNIKAEQDKSDCSRWYSKWRRILKSIKIKKKRNCIHVQ